MYRKTLANLGFAVIIALALASVSLSQAGGGLVYGKYGCTSSHYNSKTGYYEYEPKGSFTITAQGKYSYLGFEKPSNGTFTVDDDGNLNFHGGYLAEGVATKIDRPNKFFLVFPTIPDNRWTCGLVDK